MYGIWIRKSQKKFGGEAASTVVYLINKCPLSALNYKTPTKAWYGSLQITQI
jgi:hypothetical protein